MSDYFLAPVMSPIERLDKLVLEGTMSIAEDGYVMWCYMCETFVRTEGEFEDTHGWFDDGARRYLDHVSACCARGREAESHEQEQP